MINYSIVHGGVDQDGNEIPPRFVQVAITKKCHQPSKIISIIAFGTEICRLGMCH